MYNLSDHFSIFPLFQWSIIISVWMLPWSMCEQVFCLREKLGFWNFYSFSSAFISIKWRSSVFLYSIKHIALPLACCLLLWKHYASSLNLSTLEMKERNTPGSRPPCHHHHPSHTMDSCPVPWFEWMSSSNIYEWVKHTASHIDPLPLWGLASLW